MSNKDHAKESISTNQERINQQLWEDLKIYFRLQSEAFSDNRIIGSINIKPDDAAKLIKNFVLVTNSEAQCEFDCNYRKISAAGFDSSKKDFSVHIQAIPIHSYLIHNPKISGQQHFDIVRQRCPLRSTISYEWPSLKGPKPRVIIRWFHIGDKIAHVYVLCLDGKEIQYIRKPSEYDAYKVCINNFEPGTEHVIQILARLNNGKETYQSKRRTITIPVRTTEHLTEIINVNQEPGLPDDMQDLIDEYEKKTDNSTNTKNPLSNKSFNFFQQRKPQTEQQLTYKKTNTLLSCGCDKPHERFLGIDHYLQITKNEPSSYAQTKPVIKPKCVSPNEEDMDDDNNNEQQEEKSDEEYNDYDDDDDVIDENDY